MIATLFNHHEHFDDDTLGRLLADDLSAEDSDRVERHLNGCAQCQETLQAIAGADHWWDETVHSLSQTLTASRHGGPTNRSEATSPPWLQPILRSSQSPDEIGRLDEYPIHDVIGQGGMGVVLRGIDPHLNRPVAVKVLAPHLAGVGAARKRFMREAQAAAMIVHPSVVPIYSIAREADLPYLVMPVIEGGNLQQRIDRDGPLELEEILRIGIQIAAGLAAAHDKGVIHRDIKPANVLLERGNGRALIGDFGLARAIDDATLTVSGIVTGTPQYMSPEQALGDSVDERSDLFSLGSLLYAAATGRAPFRADSPLAVLRKVTESAPKPLHEINERLPPWFSALVGQLMAIDVDQRIRSASDAEDLLQSAHRHVSNPSVHPLPTSLMPNRRSRSRWLMTLMFATPAIAVCGWLAWPHPEPTATTTVPSSDKPTIRHDHTWLHPSMDLELQSLGQTLDQLDQSLSSHRQQLPTQTDRPKDE